MTDLETLRRALRAPLDPGYDGPAFDIGEIIIRGRRRRWHRRAVAAVGSVCVAAAVFGAVTGITRLTAPAPQSHTHPVSPVSSVNPIRRVPPPAPSPGRASASPIASPSPAPTVSANGMPTPTPTQSPTTVPTTVSMPSATPRPSTTGTG